jgi:hypothetical protein
VKFWIPWSVDALVALVVLGFFAVGVGDGSVSSYNIGLWSLILLVVAAVLGGSLFLRSQGRPGAATLVALLLAVPALLLCLFFAVMLLTVSRWN